MKQEFPTSETPKQAATFICRFMEVKGEFLQSDFRTPGWVHSTKTNWWVMMASFVLQELEELLLQCRLYQAVRAVCYEITPSHYNFFVMLEKYNPDTCTFFALAEEMEFVVHEMFEVSGLSMGDLPYEEYISDTEELHLLKKDAPQVYETYWEVLCLTFVLRQPDRGLGESSRCHGQLSLLGFGGEIKFNNSAGSHHRHLDCREDF